jgi:hypothetical protein
LAGEKVIPIPLVAIKNKLADLAFHHFESEHAIEHPLGGDCNSGEGIALGLIKISESIGQTIDLGEGEFRALPVGDEGVEFSFAEKGVAGDGDPVDPNPFFVDRGSGA